MSRFAKIIPSPLVISAAVALAALGCMANVDELDSVDEPSAGAASGAAGSGEQALSLAAAEPDAAGADLSAPSDPRADAASEGPDALSGAPRCNTCSSHYRPYYRPYGYWPYYRPYGYWPYYRWPYYRPYSWVYSYPYYRPYFY